MTQPLVPAPEAALRARESRERIVRLVQQGLLRGELVRGRWFVNADDLERFIAQPRPEPAGAA